MSTTIHPSSGLSVAELALLADGLLRERAIQAVEQYLQEVEKGAREIRPSQIHGLRVIAQYEPEQIRNFALKQKERAEARSERAGGRNSDEESPVIRFWKLVEGLFSEGSKGNAWSLPKACKEALPAELQVAELPSGARLSSEEQKARQQIKQRADQWKKDWLASCVPVFFQHFCVHFLYRTQPLRTSDQRHD